MSRSYTRADIAGTIDHSVLQPQLTRAEARASIELGRAFGVKSCCVRPSDVPLAQEILAGSETLVSTVIGFPHGSNSTAIKVAEAVQAIAEGAIELDMVCNIARLRSGTAEDDAYVQADIAAVVAAGRPHPRVIVKVILENAYLNDEQKARGCRLIEAAGAHFAKTSTGFAVVPADKPAGATLPDLRLMRATCGPAVAVKAAGGVRTLDSLLDALGAGATRVGATATKAILEDFDGRTAATGGVLTVEAGASAASAAAAPSNAY